MRREIEISHNHSRLEMHSAIAENAHVRSSNGMLCYGKTPDCSPGREAEHAGGKERPISFQIIMH